MSNSIQNNSATILSVLACIAMIAAAVVVFLPAWGPHGYRIAPEMMSNTQLRSIHQAMIIYAQDNKFAGSDGWYPGLDNQGNVIPNSSDTGYSGDGLEPAARLWVLLDMNAFTPEYMISPKDEHKVEAEIDPKTGRYQRLTSNNFSYAMLGFAPGNEEAKLEWKETLNTSAVAMSDRAIGTDPSDISSVWTTAGSGDWRGGIAKNDNSVSFEITHIQDNTRYASYPANLTDDIFDNDPTAADAFLVHEDATTAYGSR